MSVSFVFIGILVVLDILFLVNYLAIKSIRAWTDQREEQLETAARSAAVDSAHAASSNCLQRLFSRSSSHPKSTTVYLQALFMDVVHRDQSSVQKFANWRDIPWACGKWSTVALVSLSLLLLSVEFAAHDTIARALQASSRDLCRTTDFEGKLDNFELQMASVANLKTARKQYNWTERFYQALATDTSLYGTYGYQCETVNGVSGSKYSTNWTNSDESFFPGYCSARKRAEISFAKSATCTRRQCECAKIFRIPVCWIAKLCLDIGDPCPEYTGDLETELYDYETESDELYVAEVQNEANANQTALPSISTTISTAAAKTIGKILYQVNVASTAYVIYNLIALFFPAPLQMFRLPYTFYIKSYLFGIHKPTFILFVVALWWGFEYFKPFWNNPEIQLYMKMLRIGDPCLFDADFIDAKVDVVDAICQELMAMKAQFTTSTLEINRLAAGVGFFFNSCNCSFPNQNLIRFQTPEYIFKAQANELGFVREMDGLCEPPTCNRIFLPAKDNPFLGETSMCSDANLARQYLLTATGDGVSTNWWQLLLSTGFLSKLLISVVVTNFCIRLYRLADPLSSCGGRYEWPPEYLFRERDEHTGTELVISPSGMPSSTGAKLRQRKTISLSVISFKWAVFWGALTHLCLLNLALAPIEDESVGRNDIIVLVIYSTIAVTSVGLLICLRRRLRRHQVDGSVKSVDSAKSYVSLELSQSQRASPLLSATSSESSNDSCTEVEANLSNGHIHVKVGETNTTKV